MKTFIHPATGERFTAYQFSGSSTDVVQLKSWLAGGDEPRDGIVHTRDIVTFQHTFTGSRYGTYTVQVEAGDWIIQTATGEFALTGADYMALCKEVTDEH